MGIWYANREQVKDALDSAETARNNAKVDRAIESASRAVESLTHRRFYPEIDTRTFDWSPEPRSDPWRLWLGADELISATTVTAGGVAIVAADYFLRPDTGPPYDRIEIDRGSAAGWVSAASPQQAIAITGVFGYTAATVPAGSIAEDLTDSETEVQISNAAAVGVGDIVQVGTERMIVTGRAMLDTGQNLQTNMAAAASAVTCAVTTGSAYNVDETLLLDAERMRIVDIAGNNLVVKRAVDGSVLAAHSGSDIYAARSLTVTRGALGTTAAAHSNGATLLRHDTPGPVRDYVIGLALHQVLSESAGWARTVGAGDVERETVARGLDKLARQVLRTYGRRVRNTAV